MKTFVNILWLLSVAFAQYCGAVIPLQGYTDNLYDRIKKQSALENADQPVKKSAGLRVLQAKKIPGVPESKAQFDLNIRSWTFNGGAGDWSGKVPVFLFGVSDRDGNYRKGLGLLPLPSNITFSGATVYPDLPGGFGAGLTVAQVGDLVLSFLHSNGSRCCIIINCSQVAYCTLLAATNSDRFMINLIRYSLPSTIILTQFNEAIKVSVQSLFGKSSDDSINPLSYKNPNQNQSNLIDILAGVSINKRTELLTYVSPIVGAPIGGSIQGDIFYWSIFVEAVDKL